MGRISASADHHARQERSRATNLERLLTVDCIYAAMLPLLSGRELLSLLQSSAYLCGLIENSPYSWTVIDASEMTCANFKKLLYHARNAKDRVTCLHLDWNTAKTMSRMLACDELRRYPKIASVSIIGIGAQNRSKRAQDHVSSGLVEDICGRLIQARDEGRLSGLKSVAMMGGPGFQGSSHGIVPHDAAQSLLDHDIMTDLSFCGKFSSPPPGGPTSINPMHQFACVLCEALSTPCVHCLHRNYCMDCGLYCCPDCVGEFEKPVEDCNLCDGQRRCESCADLARNEEGNFEIYCRECDEVVCKQHNSFSIDGPCLKCAKRMRLRR